MVRNVFPIFSFALLFLLSSNSLLAKGQLNDLEVGLGGKELSFDKSPLFGSDKYRTGDKLERPKVTDSLLQNDPVFRDAVLRTGKIRGATGFFVGIFKGQYVVATNHHVCPSPQRCVGTGIYFPFLRKTLRLNSMLGTWKNIDLAMLTMKVPETETALFRPLATNFEFSNPLFAGQKLFTTGFGRANNLWGNLTYNRDPDCIVFSKKGDFKLMADPDQVNPGKYKAWSFSHGCDISHGDSGSAIFDENSGKIIGIAWTGKIPKKSQIKNSQYLRGLIGSDSSEIWNELNYGVPSMKIHDVLKSYLREGTFSSKLAKEVLQEVIR